MCFKLKTIYPQLIQLTQQLNVRKWKKENKQKIYITGDNRLKMKMRKSFLMSGKKLF